MTVEPSVLLEKEIKDDPKFATAKDSFRTWDDNDKGSYITVSESGTPCNWMCNNYLSSYLFQTKEKKF